MSNPDKTKPAVQLILGSQAIQFPLPITVKKLDGSEAVVTFTCKAMRKTAWAKARDQHQQAMLRNAADTVQVARPTEPDALADYVGAHGVHSVVARGLKTDADLVLQFACGWDLSDPLTADSLSLLEDEFGGTLGRLLAAYEAAIYQGRLGN
jgi:hypothetical protein